MIAQVIVDVPSRQTDRPFDYEIPADLEGWVEVGSRVGVPFGGRVVQGFVVGVTEFTDVNYAKLKPITELLDHTPPLSPDLIELAQWISDKYCCALTTSLQVMIPAALKGKADTVVSINEDDVESSGSLISYEGEWMDYLRRNGGSSRLSALQQRFSSDAGAIKQAIREGILTEQVSIRDRMAVRKVLTVFPPEDRVSALDALATFPARAAKQREVLRYMLERDKPTAMQTVVEEVPTTSATVKALVDKGFIALRGVEHNRDPYAGREFHRTVALPLTEGQQDVYGDIVAALDSVDPRVFLLHGVTGSGKTEVYLQTIAHCLKSGRQAIVLVPEISLTPQMVERFKGRFGDEVAVLHSRLSNGERYDEWRKIRERRASVAVGARSAVFAPFERIGLIIIDEEHESSYKQEETPKYHARDVAIRRARQHGAAVVLGSATPSLESFAAATRGGLSASTDAARSSAALLPMPNRVGMRPMPQVHLVDMREELKEGNRSMFSRQLHEALQLRLERGEQSVLLLNRRGYSTFVMCRSCGYTALCPHCDISLTYHQKSRVLRCHYCGHSEQAPTKCPTCESEHIRFFGTGTQRVEEELSKLFPGIRVIRMDVDTTTEKGSHEKWLNLFGERKADVLLGTQMVAKGLDFPYVTLVGVIAADTSLHLPDFRAAEKTFQLLTQVAGRAGRHELLGEVIVQTYNPDHYAITTAQNHDYEAFVQEELRHRRFMAYPPFCRLILVTLSDEQLAVLITTGEKFASLVRKLVSEAGVRSSDEGDGSRYIDILGPVASPIPRIKDRYRFQCMLKYRGNVDAVGILKQAILTLSAPKGQPPVQISVDVDPQVII
ncbi:primosomal protein N' [Paenibacillus baekrokdamisoli]|uniref:Replication restart protein PriA n=1 Tax=Paenibacillus baekrokdamisoli TaxID=1712516 RepID=A0A3G9J8P9_9BACL|nr:primosomal protein N' [Paenibacillus baekrokdamisoli]MBB3067164.1 primosomal protein N' (replication factor Y) [Paenibacillus baekrokdamisoli]BBH19644.1 primosomal protein N' [Paenibacillus baekrokdamisoli]